MISRLRGNINVKVQDEGGDQHGAVLHHELFERGLFVRPALMVESLRFKI